MMKQIFMGALLAGMVSACSGSQTALVASEGDESAAAVAAADTENPWEMDMDEQVVKTDEEWQQLLTPEQYRILREKGTERAGTGAYAFTKEKGVYHCAACGKPLFSSDTKYESGTGWPSFWQPLSPESIQEEEDNTLFMARTEVLCGRCGGHLGHVFDDGPPPTGLRYCLNSASLKLVPGEE